jgi:hypothetical protein
MLAIMPTTDYQAAFQKLVRDPRYLKNLDWGDPRPGHAEGTVRSHIQELEGNLLLLAGKLTDVERWKLKLLIHTHDTFKSEAAVRVPIEHPRSHASLARAFLAEYVCDPGLLATVQYHDEPYALWKKYERTGAVDQERFRALHVNVDQYDWDLFLAFQLIDGCTASKSRQPLLWFFSAARHSERFTEKDILP